MPVRSGFPLLVDHFIRKFSVQQGKQIEGISEEALRVLMGHQFPGSVRELQNVIERAVVLCRGERIEIECLPGELVEGRSGRSGGGPTLAGGPLPEAEAAAILRALREHGGHRGRTAAALGIDKTTLWRKMKKYGLSYP